MLICPAIHPVIRHQCMHSKIFNIIHSIKTNIIYPIPVILLYSICNIINIFQLNWWQVVIGHGREVSMRCVPSSPGLIRTIDIAWSRSFSCPAVSIRKCVCHVVFGHFRWITKNQTNQITIPMQTYTTFYCINKICCVAMARSACCLLSDNNSHNGSANFMTRWTILLHSNFSRSEFFGWGWNFWNMI